MKTFRWLAACFALTLLLAPPAAAQDGTPLAAGVSVADTLPPGETRTYPLDVDAEWFVSGRVEQDGVEVTLTITDPEGETAEQVESSLGVGAPVTFSFTTDAQGTYRIQVSARDEDAEGPFRIRLARVEPVATTPEGRVAQAMSMFARDTPGGVVAVIRGGQVDYFRGFGQADLTHSVPFTGRTITNIGSTSKQFTGFALALLESRGELSLDDEVRQYLPELKDFGHTITLRHLLSHTTGYREFVNTLLMGGRQVLESDHVAPSEIVDVINRQPELQNVPGEEFNYNNSGFALATMVVERATGRPFAEWMRDEVFHPLGMYDTYVRVDPGQVIPRRAAGYTPGEVGFKEVRDLGASAGAGGIYTTPADLARWMGNFATAALGGPEVIEALTTPFTLTNGESTNYGLGLFLAETGGLTTWHHGGADVAHRSTFVYFPELEAGYVVLSNYAALPGSVGNVVADAFFGSYMEEPDEEEGPAEEPTADTDDAEDEAEEEPAPDLAEFTGRYFSPELETFYELAVEDDALVILHRRFDPAPLSHSEGDEFSGTLPVTDVVFERDGQGAVVGFRAGNGRARDIWFERVDG